MNVARLDDEQVVFLKLDQLSVDRKFSVRTREKENLRLVLVMVRRRMFAGLDSKRLNLLAGSIKVGCRQVNLFTVPSALVPTF